MAEPIYVTRKDETFSIVDLSEDKALGEELYEFFSFMAPGYQYNKMYKRRLWNGKLSLFNKHSGALYTGLLPYLRLYADTVAKRPLEGLPSETRKSLPEGVLGRFTSSLGLVAHGKPVEPHWFQVDAVTKALERKRITLLSPTSSGKSMIIYMLTRWYLTVSKGKTLIVVPTVNLVEQMHSDFIDYRGNRKTKTGAGVAEFDPIYDVHKIKAGQSKTSDCPVIISTWQSIYEMPPEWFEQFSSVICDEAHLAKAQSIRGIMEKCPHVKNRVALTGTIEDIKSSKLTVEGLFGPCYQVVKTKKLMEDGHVSDLDIKIITLTHETEQRPLDAKSTYQEEVDFVVSSEPRNRKIARLADKLPGNTMILCNMIDRHLLVLAKVLEEVTTKKVYLVHGKVDAEDRETIRQALEKENNAIILASYGVFSTGVSIRNLQNIIFASPTKSKIRTLQSIGRVLRLDGKTNKATLWDIADKIVSIKTTGKLSRWENYGIRHLVERMKYYKAEKFPFEIIPITLTTKKDAPLAKGL